MAGWRIVRTKEALRVEHAACPPITIAVEGWRFVLSGAGRDLGRFPFFDVRAVGRCVTEAMRRSGSRWGYGIDPPAAAVPHPAIVTGRLLAERDRLLAAVDPQVHVVWTRITALVARPPQLLCSEALHAAPFVVSDVLAYRAAAIALAHVETTLRPAALVWDVATPAGEAALVDAMRAWRGLFAPDGRSYRSLDRTLMRLPDAVPADLVCELRGVRLERPLLDVLELTTVLLAQRAYRRRAGTEAARTHLHAIAHARAGEILAALGRAGELLGRRLSPRRPADVEAMLRLLADYPEPSRGRFAGLVARALGWHRVAPETRAEVRALGGPGMPTARPPIPLPDDPEIEFLDTIEAVVREGERMRHCVAVYARPATLGECFLFHVRHAGSEATVEVDRTGRVAQASGPGNVANAAARWGRRRLAAWARDLLPAPVRRRRDCAAEARRRRRARAAMPVPEQLAFWPVAAAAG